MENNLPEAPQTNSQNNLAVPFAIVIAGLAIATAVYFGDDKKAITPLVEQQQQAIIAPVTQDDHILGNPKAKIVIVEYSDTECPFCKMFHETMNKVMNEYGEGGKVAWVYRHSPIASLHPKAHKEAQATECAALLGNAKFWDYTNKLFAVTPTNNKLEEGVLFTIAQDIGLEKEAFTTCLEGGSMAARVDRDLASGEQAGVRGTPHSLVLINGKLVKRIEGAESYESVKKMIDQYIAQ